MSPQLVDREYWTQGRGEYKRDGGGVCACVCLCGGRPYTPKKRSLGGVLDKAMSHHRRLWLGADYQTLPPGRSNMLYF